MHDDPLSVQVAREFRDRSGCGPRLCHPRSRRSTTIPPAERGSPHPAVPLTYRCAVLRVAPGGNPLNDSVGQPGSQHCSLGMVPALAVKARAVNEDVLGDSPPACPARTAAPSEPAATSPPIRCPGGRSDEVPGVLPLPPQPPPHRRAHCHRLRQLLTAPDHETLPPGRGLGRGEQRRDRLHPTNSSWLNRIEAQFTALHYFALDDTDHPSHKAQGSIIRRYIIWRNEHAADERLRKVVNRANVA